MKNTVLKIILLAALYNIISCINAYTQNLGIGYSPSYRSSQGKQEKDKSKDPFIKNIAVKFNWNPGELYFLREVGYGRVELIKLLLIAAKADVPLNPIIEARAKNMRISRIAKKYNVDYKSVYREAYIIRTELEAITTTQAEISMEKSTDTLTSGTTSATVLDK
jgi:hypothetical protein